ncbi:MAG: hypothetical protein ACI95T_000172, partial [Flavobacteriales bacterium]
PETPGTVSAIPIAIPFKAISKFFIYSLFNMQKR